jgi:hypothetical protein
MCAVLASLAGALIPENARSRTLTLQYTLLTRKAGGSILPSPYTTPLRLTSENSTGWNMNPPDLVPLLAVVDTKYKVPDSPSTADVSQVVAYAEAKGCQEAVLVYPIPLKKPLRDTRIGKIRVRTLAFRLDGDLDTNGLSFRSGAALNAAATGLNTRLVERAQGVISN